MVPPCRLVKHVDRDTDEEHRVGQGGEDFEPVEAVGAVASEHASVSMWPASESRASELARKPAATSTTMKKTTSAKVISNARWCRAPARRPPCSWLTRRVLGRRRCRVLGRGSRRLLVVDVEVVLFGDIEQQPDVSVVDAVVDDAALLAELDEAGGA